ncbi:MAG: ABC transporter permease [Oscillospiraceae bacterium]|nr:ABC transporter permease [Oscillospiraceae bacterium]
MSEKTHTPLFHVSRRPAIPAWHAWAIRIGAVIIAMILSACIMGLATGQAPWNIAATQFDGVFGTPRRLWITGQNTAILLLISLAVTPAFKMRFWNIGAEGQVLVGCLASAACMILLGGKIPNPALIALMAVSAMAAGALWALIPAIFKVLYNTNETLFTLMMNYLATQLVAYFIIVWEVPKGSGKVGIINQTTEAGWLPVIGGQENLLPIIVGVIITALMFVYLNYSKHGYEIAVVGESERTARYVGIKVGKVVIRTMLLSGALCGLVGLLIVGGLSHTISAELAGGRGFTAVMVSWLAQFNPITMIFSSLLIVYMDRGAGEISTIYGLNHAFSDIMTGIILFFIIGSEFFINYRIDFVRRAGKEEKTNV